MLERKFQGGIIRRIEHELPGSIVIKNDPNYIQGFPDLLVLFPNGRWAALECKASAHAKHRPNQDYYITHRLAHMSFASFVYPENEEEVMHGLQATYGLYR